MVLCQGLPHWLFMSIRRPMHGTTCPKSQLKCTYLTAKFGSFLDHTETGKKRQNVNSSSVQHPISLIFAIHVSFIIPLPIMWTLLTKPMQKSVTTVCLHCGFARLKDKHIGVLEINVATISWLHWSPVSGYKLVGEKGIMKYPRPQIWLKIVTQALPLTCVLSFVSRVDPLFHHKGTFHKNVLLFHEIWMLLSDEREALLPSNVSQCLATDSHKH